MAAVKAHQLRSTRVELNAAKAQDAELTAQVATLQGQVAALQSQASSLQGTLTQRTQERDAARAQESTYLARLRAIPKPFAVAIEQVRREVAWAQHWNSPYSYGRLVAQAAMDYVLGHVQPGAYGYLLETGGALPIRTPDSILGMQAGICGHVAFVFGRIVAAMGVPVRSVQFYHGVYNHIADEVYYEGGWHFFDAMYGLVWKDAGGSVLSMSDARANGATVERDTVSFANLIDDYQVGFELDASTVVVLGAQSF